MKINNHIQHVLCIAAVIVTAAMIQMGCSGTSYGGRPVVTYSFQSEPQGADLYIVEWSVWKRTLEQEVQGKDPQEVKSILSSNSMVRKLGNTSVSNPMKRDIKPYRHALIGVTDKEWSVLSFAPSTGENITIAF